MENYIEVVYFSPEVDYQTWNLLLNPYNRLSTYGGVIGILGVF